MAEQKPATPTAPKPEALPKFVLLHGTLKHKDAPSSKPGDTVEMSQAAFEAMPKGVLMPAADFAEVDGSTTERKLKILKEEARHPSMKVKPDAQTPVAGPTVVTKKGA